MSDVELRLVAEQVVNYFLELTCNEVLPARVVCARLQLTARLRVVA